MSEAEVRRLEAQLNLLNDQQSSFAAEEFKEPPKMLPEVCPKCYLRFATVAELLVHNERHIEFDKKQMEQKQAQAQAQAPK